MNPEPHSAAGSEVPDEAPAAASPAAPVHAAAAAAPATPGDIGGDDAPDTVPDQLRELPPEPTLDVVSPAESSPAVESQIAAAPPAVPELSPAAVGARLAELFPALFAAAAPGAPGAAKPIKLRIHADIQARAPGVFTKRVLGIFFSRYTTTNAYLKALAAAPQRLDLDGQPAGEISDEHRQLATEELVRRHALAAERRAAQRPPRRDLPPVAEGEAEAGATGEARPQRRLGPRPARRPDNRPSAPPSQQPQDGAQRSERPAIPPAPRSVDRPPHAAQPQRHQRPDPAAQAQRMDAPAAMPADPAQRERAMLLHSFESSPLSKANFCALKGITEAALDAALAQAQTERGAPSNSAGHRGGRR